METEILRDTIIQMAKAASVEVLTFQLNPKNLEANLPKLNPKRRIFVPSIPPQDPAKPSDPLKTTIAYAVTLKQRGCRPVPHVPVRNYQDETHLEQALKILSEAGINEILLLAGDNQHPRALKDTSAVLSKTGAENLLIKYGIRNIAFAGHPQGNPNSPSAQDTDRMVRMKSHFVKVHPEINGSLITQLVFRPKSLIQWAEQQRDGGLSVIASVFAPLKGPKSVYVNARRSGYRWVTMLKNGPAMAAQYLEAWFRGENPVPDKLIIAAAKNPAIAGIHVFGFGNIEGTEKMVSALEEGRFNIVRDWRGQQRLRIDGFSKRYGSEMAPA